MKEWLVRNKKTVIAVIVVALIIAAVLDLAFKGLLYQVLAFLI